MQRRRRRVVRTTQQRRSGRVSRAPFCLDHAPRQHRNPHHRTESARRAGIVLAPRVGELVGRAEQPSIPVAADGARVRAGVESETPRRIRARDERFRRHRFRVDRRDAQRTRPSAEARSVVLRRRIRRHSDAPAAHRRRGISRRRRHDPVRCLVVPGTAAACLAAGRSVRACRARQFAVGDRDFCRRVASVCERSRLGLCSAVDRYRRPRRTGKRLRIVCRPSFGGRSCI